MSKLLDDFARVSRRHPCPICGRPDWCLISRDDLASPSRVICARVESSKRAGEAGWLHVLRDKRSHQRKRYRKHVASTASSPRHDFRRLSERMQAAVDPDRLHEFAQDLGLPAESLRRLGIGLAAGEDVAQVGLRLVSHAWTFPMVNPQGPVVGLRVRLPGGKKLCVAGSKLGLFVPNNLPERPRRLFVTEGETDAAAMGALGFDAVGRPGASNGRMLLSYFVQRVRPWEIVVLADADEPGRRGGRSLAGCLALSCPTVRLLVTPTSDAREWVRNGVTASEVLGAVETALRFGIFVSEHRRKRP